jgi:hypothetical protein
MTKSKMPLQEEASDSETAHDRDDRPDDPFPELVEMLQKRHLSGAVGPVLVPVGIALLVRRGRLGLVGKRHEGHRDYAGLLLLARLTDSEDSGVDSMTGEAVLAASIAEFCSASIFVR